MALSATALVVGTFDTKGAELEFIALSLRNRGVRVKTIDLSTSGKPSTANVSPQEIASHHVGGSDVVFSDDRGKSVNAMAAAFAVWIEQQSNINGIISAGGSGGTTLATAGMRKLAVGIPKIMVSTVASGEVGHYVGPCDIMMMYSVADVQGINAITSLILANAAHALAGMILGLPATNADRRDQRATVGFSMFGVTTPCVQALQKKLGADFECLIFHATGAGGRAMENLVDSNLINAVLDITTTEVADMIVGGVFPATEDRFGAVIRKAIPFVGSVGALDMVNFGPCKTVPDKFANRKFVVHNDSVTLMRTTPDENRKFGIWIGERLNLMPGEVRFLLPEGGVSSLDAPEKPFYDLEASQALFEAVEKTVQQTPKRQVQRVPGNINDPSFITAALDAFADITPNLARKN